MHIYITSTTFSKAIDCTHYKTRVISTQKGKKTVDKHSKT